MIEREETTFSASRPHHVGVRNYIKTGKTQGSDLVSSGQGVTNTDYQAEAAYFDYN